MIPEATIAMLATAHLGAIHCVVFGGFAPTEFSKRIESAEPKIILTASCGIEGGAGGKRRVIPYLPLVSPPKPSSSPPQLTPLGPRSNLQKPLEAHHHNPLPTPRTIPKARPHHPRTKLEPSRPLLTRARSTPHIHTHPRPHIHLPLNHRRNRTLIPLLCPPIHHPHQRNHRPPQRCRQNHLWKPRRSLIRHLPSLQHPLARHPLLRQRPRLGRRTLVYSVFPASRRCHDGPVRRETGWYAGRGDVLEGCGGV